MSGYTSSFFTIKKVCVVSFDKYFVNEKNTAHKIKRLNILVLKFIFIVYYTTVKATSPTQWTLIRLTIV